MSINERALQLWSILVLAAHNQQILSYATLGKLTGLSKQGVGTFLAPIQHYCKNHDLPPLTILAISEVSGLPSKGFTEAKNDDGLTVGERVFCEQSRVFVYDWLKLKTPKPNDFSGQPTSRRRRLTTAV